MRCFALGIQVKIMDRIQRPKVIVLVPALLLLVLEVDSKSFALPDAPAAPEINQSVKAFSADWPAERPPGDSLLVSTTSNCGSGRPPNHFIYWIKNYFEPNNLSKHASAEIRLQVKTENWKNWFKLWETGCTPADAFYIQQTIWEASLFANTDHQDIPGKCKLSYKMNAEDFLTSQQSHRRKIIPLYAPIIVGRPDVSRTMTAGGFRDGKQGLCSNFSCKALYCKQHPEMTKDFVVLHHIPVDIGQCFPEAIEQNELHSLKNLKAMDISKLKSADLDAFREDWHKFIKINAFGNSSARKAIKKEADRLAVKYRSLFLANKLTPAEQDSIQNEYHQFVKENASSVSSTATRQMILKEADRLASKYHALFLE